MKHKICSLDVWGNEVDGYEINDWYTIGYAEFTNDAEFYAVLECYLIGDVKKYDIRDECNGFIEVSDPTNGKPLLQIYAQHE